MGRAAHIPPIIVATLALLMSGCAQWSQRAASEEDPFAAAAESPLPTLKLAGDSVMLEVANATVLEPNQEEFEAAWREIDELAIDAQTRRKLAENGFRLGRISGALPVGVRQLVEKPRDQVQTPDGESSFDQLQIHRVHLALGREKEVTTGPERDELVVLRNNNGRSTGRTLEDAQCRFTLRAESEVDGNRLYFKPWIIHGPIKQSYSGEGGAWRISPERQRAEFPELDFDVPLAPGETLILAPTPKLVGVGKLFFGETPAKPRFLLIRLASSKANALFDDGASDIAPISSLGE